MIENTFRISLRLASDSFDFKELIPEIKDYEVIYNRKGINHTKYGVINARANILLINNFYVGNNIDDEDNAIINKIRPIIKTLSVIDVNDLKREIYITGAIENQQFGFSINHDVINLLAENKYTICFSGISYLTDEAMLERSHGSDCHPNSIEREVMKE
jgi:hypothetical protein